MTHEHLGDRELLLLVLENQDLILEKQEQLMASTTALTAAVAELQTIAGEIVTVVSGNEDQAAIDSAVATIESVVTELKGALPKPAAPVVSSLSPASGAEGSSVTITGTGFTGATAVDFGGNAATYTVGSDTEIVATVPAGSGEVGVTVTGPGGSSAADTFTYA